MAVLSENNAFQINDIIFSVGPNNIQVQKENLSYRWHVLRQSSSTKIPTGHGGCIVNISIPIPREDILKLHRLIIEFKQNPFAYIENKYLRDEIVPHWPSHQSMAFTLLNMQIDSVVGNVGLFVINLQMQWFNYFAYTHNFWFREEWETDWISVANLSDTERESFPYLLGYKPIEEGKSISFIKKSIFDYITNQTDNPPQDAHYKATAGDLEKQLDNWNGFIFDLLPLPVGMGKAKPVLDPRTSKIYVRYFNELQNRALSNNFNIDLNTYNWLGGKDYYYGLLSGSGGEFDGEHVTLPEYTARKGIAGRIISEMTKHDSFHFTFNTYKFVSLPPTVKKALSIATSDHIKNTVFAIQGATASGYDLTKITSPYGERLHPVSRQWKMHYGIDLGYSIGTPIPPVASGTVEYIKTDPSGGGGLEVKIRHDDGTTTSRYLHLYQILVAKGDKVTTSTIIATTGNSGASTGPHLHLEIRPNDRPVDPVKWFAAQTTNESVEYDRLDDISEDVDGDGKELIKAPAGKPDISKQTSNEIKPWFSVLDTMPTEVSEEDRQFLAELAIIVSQGYRLYTKDPTINGVFYKPVTIRIKGHGAFNGETDSHNTVLTKINGTLRHIVAAIPILGQEFPTHQHLGSTDASYNFEFVTLDHDGDRAGMGGGAKLLEAARITLQQNGRNIRNIYDSWMATGDNFITRLLGTYDHSGPNSKKLIIASTQAATMEGTPGSSVLVMQCEETLSIVNENLTKTNSASKGDYEAVYRKIINKITEITKLAKMTPQKALDQRVRKDIRDNVFNPSTMDNTAIAFVGSAGASGPTKFANLGNDIQDRFFNNKDLYDHDNSADAISAINAEFYELDTSKVSGLTEEDREHLVNVITRLSHILLLGQLILMEKSVGGFPQNSGDASHIVYDLYGAEDLLIPKGNKFIAYCSNHFGPFSQSIFAFGPRIFTMIGKSFILIGGSSNNFFEALHTGVDNMAPNSLAQLEPTVPGQNTNTLMNSVESVFQVIIDTVRGVGKAAEESRNFEPELLNPWFSEIIIRSYLSELYDFSSEFSAAFVSSTTEYASARLNNILPTNRDGSPLIQERFGLVSSVLQAIDNRINNSSLGNITNRDWERNKAELIKGEIINILQPVLNQPNLMDFFGIAEDVANLLYKVIRDEKDCLPDMLLPPHPYWGKTYLTPPDFYYFNYHEDGVYTSDGYSLYSALSGKYVDGIHSFMDTWVRDGLNVDLTGNVTAGETQEQNTRDRSTTFHTTFDGNNNTASESFPKDLKQDGFAPNSSDRDSIKSPASVIPLAMHASTFDRDILYAPISNDELRDKIKGTEFFFGRKEGYANEREEIARIFQNNKTPLKGPATETFFTHFYGAEDLKDIVNESKKDIISQKFTMKRAFPTFRLYLIEEDQTEDFLMRYDDFYHYNAIKDITVVRSRKISGDTAVIVMQNIAGILDGSKRNILKDTDFLLDQSNADGTLNSKGRKIEESRKEENRDTSKEESVGSIVLRPGVNMQLRMGYGNDPNGLDVKLSGRIVDVAFSDNSDLIEVTIQSFGAELEQVSKGLDPNETDTYDLTHKLLGSLMLSAELIHFGRWEVGAQYQFGEAKDRELDFRRYASNEVWQKVTGIYFANTANQIRDFYSAMADKSFLAHLTVGNDNTFLGTYAAGFISSGLTYGWNGAQLGFAAVWDVVTLPIRAAANEIIPRISNEITEKRAYMMSSPQDDNLYPPNPKDYLLQPGWISKVFKGTLTSFFDGNYIDGITRGGKEILRGLLSQKMDLKALTYVIDNATIWQVFHEMTLRHPGYVYSALPYGKEFRYTMFFGVPSQRYWSKPAHPYFIARTNEIRKNLSSELGDKPKEQGLQDAFEGTYGVSDFIKIFNHNKKLLGIKSVLDLIDYSQVGDGPSPANMKAKITSARSQAANNAAAEIIEQQEMLAKMGFESVREAMLEYYTALTLRFEPFRRYHISTSETDIVSNNINLSEYNVANAVAVKYFNKDIIGFENEGIALVKMHNKIPDDEIKLLRVPDYSNVTSKLMALRYATGQLVYEAKEMYSGSILLVGNSRIKPWDILFIVDKYNDICGPVEVEQIVERFSFDTGYITEVKPNAVVFTNEISSFPILEGLKAFVAARTYEQEALYMSYKGNQFFNDLAVNGFNIIESMDTTIGTTFLKGHAARDLASFSQEQISKYIGIPELSGSSSTQSTIASMAWLIGGYFYINKCLDAQSIIVYPLLKNGIPMVAGIPSAQVETLWSITFGQINSFMSDTTRGTVEFLSRWKLLGTEAFNAFTRDSELNKQVAQGSDRINGN